MLQSFIDHQAETLRSDSRRNFPGLRGLDLPARRVLAIPHPVFRWGVTQWDLIWGPSDLQIMILGKVTVL